MFWTKKVKGGADTCISRRRRRRRRRKKKKKKKKKKKITALASRGIARGNPTKCHSFLSN